MFNLNFYYTFTGRYILQNKKAFGLFFSRDILQLVKLSVSFKINNLVDLNSNEILSYYYFFIYYFGIIPYINNYVHEFSLNVHYYSFSIEYIFYKKYIYSVLFFFINDIYYMINKIYINLIKKNNY
jgi:hypothetical protein